MPNGNTSDPSGQGNHSNLAHPTLQPSAFSEHVERDSSNPNPYPTQEWVSDFFYLKILFLHVFIPNITLLKKINLRTKISGSNHWLGCSSNKFNSGEQF